jgi:hypothetical protein
MANRIDNDHQRFRKIVRGKIRKNLRKYVTTGEIFGKQGKRFVSIPMPQIHIPRFRYGEKQKGGVGHGEGDPGTPLGRGDDRAAGPDAGDLPGEHILEVDVTLEELAQILGEELHLPDIQPKGKKNIVNEKERYTGVRRVGPESLRHFKRTLREALKRQIALNQYNPDNPVIIPIKEDKYYRSWKHVASPDANAVLIYMMDVSGSMGEDQKEMVRIESFWIDTWLRFQYQGIETRYIIHDARAKEVDRDTFFHTRESGGTKISTAYELCWHMIDKEYSPSEWNIYPFHFSDGDNWGGGDTEKCLQILEQRLLPAVNVFCYGQVKSLYGSGRFSKDLQERFDGNEKLIRSDIPSKEAVFESIKDFLGKGR